MCLFCSLRASKCNGSCGAWQGSNGHNVRQRCDAMAALVRVCYRDDNEATGQAGSPEVSARGPLKTPNSELSDFSRPLRTPPDAPEQKTDAESGPPRPRRPTEAPRTCRVDGVRGNSPCALDGAPALLAAATAALSGAAAARAWLRRPQHHSAVKSRRPAAPSSRHPRKQTRRMGRAITPTSTPSRRGDSVGGRGRVLSQYIKLVV